MRDIRSDLKDRAALIENEINSAQQDFDQQLQQLKTEREARIEGLRMQLAAINKLMEAEYRRITTAPEPQAPEYRRGHEAAEDSAPQEEYRRASAPEPAPSYRRGHHDGRRRPPSGVSQTERGSGRGARADRGPAGTAAVGGFSRTPGQRSWTAVERRSAPIGGEGGLFPGRRKRHAQRACDAARDRQGWTRTRAAQRCSGAGFDDRHAAAETGGLTTKNC